MSQITLIGFALIGAISVSLLCIYLLIQSFYWAKRKLHIHLIVRKTHIQLNGSIYSWHKVGLQNSTGEITTFEEVLENKWLKRRKKFGITIIEQ